MKYFIIETHQNQDFSLRSIGYLIC
uniref:Uncharacterized protein n=1 Tax=Anguilla anguilla TaxID=7936 RepID=A0A0E9TA67_ANGAN